MQIIDIDLGDGTILSRAVVDGNFLNRLKARYYNWFVRGIDIKIKNEKEFK